MHTFRTKLTMPSMPAMPSAAASLRMMSPAKLLAPAAKLLPSQIVAVFHHHKRKNPSVALVHPFQEKLSLETRNDSTEGDPCVDATPQLPPVDSPFCRLIKQASPDELHHLVRDFLHQTYIEHMSGRSSESDLLDSILDAFYSLFRHVLSIKEISQQDFHKDIVHSVRQEFDRYVFSELMMKECSDLATMTPKQIAKVLSFVNFYMDHWNDTDFPVDSCSRMEEFKSEYLRRGVHEQVRSMVENRILLFDDDEIVENENGTLCTRISEDMSLIVSSQLAVAAESLPPSMAPAVLRACNEELHNLAGALMFHIEAFWKIMSVERLCCCINDAQILLEQFETCNETILDSADDASETLLTEFSFLAIHSTRFLCERLIMDLKEGYLQSIGTIAWERDGALMDTIVATLKDYFGDILHWVPADYFFPKVLKTCLDLILSNYVDSFFVNTMVDGLQNHSNAVHTIKADREKLWQFFAVDHNQHLGCAGFYDKSNLWNKLSILTAVANTLGVNSQPASLQDDFLLILKEFGSESGTAAILHLFGLQCRRSSKSEAQIWHETIALAQEHAAMQGLDTKASGVRYQIPDLRNSRFIKNMRAGKKVSNTGRRLDLTNTNKLLHKPVASNFVVSSRKMFQIDNHLIATWRQEL